jgi:hypothetical protein
MHHSAVTGKRPPLSPQEGWISDGHQVLHFRPLRYAHWSQALGVTLGELMSNREPPLLKRRKELTREQAIKLWSQKRKAGWQVCAPQWQSRLPGQEQAQIAADGGGGSISSGPMRGSELLRLSSSNGRPHQRDPAHHPDRPQGWRHSHVP